MPGIAFLVRDNSAALSPGQTPHAPRGYYNNAHFLFKKIEISQHLTDVRHGVALKGIAWAQVYFVPMANDTMHCRRAAGAWDQAT